MQIRNIKSEFDVKIHDFVKVDILHQNAETFKVNDFMLQFGEILSFMTQNRINLLLTIKVETIKRKLLQF